MLIQYQKTGVLLAALLFGLLLSGCGGQHEFRGVELDPAEPAPDFTLTDHTGQPFQLSEQQGDVLVIYFGFTSCPDVCPIDLANLAAARRALGNDADRVQVVFVTVDPERDTEEAIQRYVTAFDPTFIGLRGSQEELEAVYRLYGVTAIKDERAHHGHDAHASDTYNVIHSSYIYIIDRSFRWRALFSHGTPVDDLASDLRFLARERS